MRTLLTLAALAAPALAAPAGWLGLTFDAASGAATINNLNPDGSIAAALGSIQLQAGEQPQVDAFRCRPGGTTCAFLTDSGGNAALYNVTIGGKLIQRIALPGVTAHNLHTDMLTGADVFVALPAAGGALIQSAQAGKVSTVVDISSYLPAGSTVLPGSSTHCSDVGAMWVQVSATGGGNAVLVSLALRNASILGSYPLAFPGFSAMWAHCDDATSINTLGGTYVPAAGTLAYGTLNAAGAFVATATGAMPPGVTPTGLLSQPDGADWFAALYPAGANPRNGVFAFGNFAGGANSVQFQPVTYYLWGAARFE